VSFLRHVIVIRHMTSISVVFLTKTSLQILNLVDGVMVSMLASSAVDPQTIKLVFAASPLST
jgi:hypothetical protein